MIHTLVTNIFGFSPLPANSRCPSESSFNPSDFSNTLLGPNGFKQFIDGVAFDSHFQKHSDWITHLMSWHYKLLHSKHPFLIVFNVKYLCVQTRMPKKVWSCSQRHQLFKFCSGYMEFLNCCRIIKAHFLSISLGQICPWGRKHFLASIGSNFASSMDLEGNYVVYRVGYSMISLAQIHGLCTCSSRILGLTLLHYLLDLHTAPAQK